MLDAALGGLTSAVFAENDVNAAPEIIDADVTISGSTTNFNGEALSVSHNGGAEDQLSINDEGTGAGQIGFDGANVSYEGTVIGTISSDGTNGSDLVIDFDANATQAGIEALIENITYANNSDNPATSRTLNYALGVFFSENQDVFIVADNEAPSVDTNAGLTLDEGDNALITASELGVSDPDDAAGDVVFTITNNVDNGRLELTGNPGVAISSFTLAQLNNNEVRYVHDDSQTTSDSFQFTITDGEDTTGTQTFDITVTAVDDAPVVDTNTGTSVAAGFEIGIGGREVPAQWGTQVFSYAEGNYNSFDDEINGGVNSQLRIIFTTPGSVPSNGPGQVLYETGAGGRGIGLLLDDNNQLAWYSGPATSTPRMLSPISLATGTQYAVVMEIDSDNDEIRMHYEQAGNFGWFEFGRTAENSMAWSDNSNAGGNPAGVGDTNSGIGGYSGGASNTEFQGTIHTPLVLTRFPANGATAIVNDQLIFSDIDTTPDNIVYTITADVSHGELRRSGVAIGLGDTFTQTELDNGDITYLNDGTANPADSFEFSVTDGTTNITNQTYNITVDIVNSAPVIANQTFTVSELAGNNDSLGTLEVTDDEEGLGQTLSYSITGGTGMGIFAIDGSTGQVTVADNSTLDYETTTSYTLTFEVSDDAPTPATATRTITVNVQDINEQPVIAAAGPYSIAENATVGTSIGTMSATDVENHNITFAITNGNGDGIFQINGSTGEITIASTTNLNYERDNSYTLQIRARDDGTGNAQSFRNVTVNITDVNEAPTLDIETIIEEQNPGVHYSSDTGNFYQYFNNNWKYWDAEADAATRTINGVAGHLVTITSQAENDFVSSIAGNHIWLAGSDIANEGQWIWRVGPEAGTQFSQGGNSVNGMYERWAGSDPNTGHHDRMFLHTNGWWYDDNNNSNRRYVVEWEGSEVINNDTYNVSHSNVDASDLSNGHVVGTLQGYDPEGDTIEYTIQGGNTDGIFGIDINTGQITIADTTHLDATVTDSYTLTIRVQEQGAGLWSEKDITINFDDGFSLAQNNTLNVDENGNAVIANTDLQVIDPDTAAADIVYSVTSDPSNGRLELTTSPGALITSFTQDDLDTGIVRYVHNGSETLSDSFTFSVSDGTQTLPGQTFDITVDPVNQGPSIDTNTGTTVVEGGNRTITTAMLSGSDSDDGDTDITYTASNLAGGHIEVSGTTQNTFTQDDLANNRVVFVHDGGESDGSFDVSLADGGEDLATPDTATFTLTRDARNDAPTVTTNTGTTVDEGGQVTITTAELNVTDPDDGGGGLTYTLSNIENGYVALSTNTALPILSFTQAQLEANQVVFLHSGGENNGSFDISVADGGEHGAAADTATFTLTRNPVNDAPGLLVNAGSSINQNSIVIIKNSILAANDPDDSGVGLTYTVDATSNGQVEFFANPGVAINSFTQDDIDNSRVVFRHDGSAPGLGASFDFTLADGGEDLAGTVSDTFTLTVDNVNDAPSITTNSAPTFDEGSTNVITTAMLDSFDADDFGTELTWTVSNLLNGIVQVNGVTQNTFTQDDLDNGRVTFVHDDSETTTAGFDMQVADGGEDLAAPDTGTFNINITPVNEGPTLIVNDGNPNVIDFNDYTIDVFDAAQDGQFGHGSGSSISPDGNELTITGNAWKKIDINYNLTANTVLSFEFYTDDPGEIFGIGFDDASGFGGGVNGYQLGGTQIWGGMDQSFRSYSAGDGWVRFDIPIGQDYVGAMTQMVFVLDNDNDGLSSMQFRNVGFYESDQVLSVAEGGTFNITNGHISSTDVDDGPADRTFTASNISNGHIEVSGAVQNTFTQDDIDNNRVVFVHDGSETFSAGFDISLADGGEDSVSPDTGSFTLTVTPTDDAPDAATNNGMTVLEGATTAITTAMLDTEDVDTANSDVTFNVTATPGNGHLALSSNTGAAITSFSLLDLKAGNVVYVHNGGETTTDAFTFTIDDGNTTIAADTFNITITPQNDGTQITTNNGATVAEGNNVTITNAMLDMTDPDDTAAGVTYTASNITNGHIEVSGSTGTTFTQDDIDNNRVVFVHDGSETSAASFDLSLADGLEHGASADTDTFNLTVTPVNDAPVVSDSAITVDEGGSQTIDLTALVNDPENAIDPAAHIQILGTTLSSENVGNPLTGVGNADGWNSIMIVDEARTYTNTTGAPVTIDPTGFNFNAGSNGAPVTPFIVRVNGDNDFTVLAVGDSVTGFATGDVSSGFSAGDSSFVLQDGETIAMGFLDANADGSGSNDAVVRFTTGGNEIWLTGGATAGDSGNVAVGHSTADMEGGNAGNWNRVYQFNIDFDVTTPANVGSVSYDTATGVATYTHDGSETTSDTFFFVVDDGTGPIIKAVDVTINPVNDVPTLPTNTGVTLAEGGTVALDNTMLSASDIESADATLTYTITALPVGVLENTNTANVLGLGDTFTQADIDNGFIRYTHDGGESLSETLSLTIGDGTDTVAADFVFTITPVNDAPTDITMTGGEIAENSAQDTVVADLTTLDADLPGDSFTYTMAGEHADWFAISGSQIVVADNIDFETAQEVTLSITTDDGNGGTFEKDFTVTIKDIDERTSSGIVLRSDDDFEGRIEEDRAGFISDARERIFSAADVLRIEENFGNQILRENTTLELQAQLESALPFFLGSFISAPENFAFIPEEIETFEQSEENPFTTVRQALQFLEALDRQSDNSNPALEQGSRDANLASISPVEQQFQDVMTYQQMKQDRLKQALLNQA